MFEQWEKDRQKFLQEGIVDSVEYMAKRYSYDISGITSKVKSLESTIPEGYDSTPNHSLTLMDGERAVMTLEFMRVDKEFEDRLWGPDTEYSPYGDLKIVTKIALHPSLTDLEIRVFTHTMSLLLTFGMMLCPEEELNHQPPAFHEIWKMMWGIGKPVEDKGKRYLRYDDPLGWNTF